MVFEADSARASMVATLRAQGVLPDRRLEQAFRTVPRHAFLPEYDLDTAYANEALITKWDPKDGPVSSVSQPRMVAEQLIQAGVRPGDSVLEIGLGRGYNAALMGCLVGPKGHVHSIDVDTELVDQAAAILSDIGAQNVSVEAADGAYGNTEHAPYDVIVVTVGAFDIPTAWFDQLRDGGRLVVPLMFASMTRSIAFTKDGGHLISGSMEICGFLSMRGSSADDRGYLDLHNGNTRLYVQDNVVDGLERLPDLFTGQPYTAWSAIPLRFDAGASPYLELWMAGHLDPYGVLVGQHEDLPLGWLLPQGSAATWTNDSIAYVVLRMTDDHRAELGAAGFGPQKERLVSELNRLIAEWDAFGQHDNPQISVFPKTADPKSFPPGRVISKPDSYLVIESSLP
ncbi:methyltransferase, FxLD system [Haloglycomyces albus]|uniref:methyltransferase, FxLD system n=1 Tax=Haloglycomyces albus TaxID=526067 RepID=UPI00046CC89C|nr:methyltransferase, FxLD system [Haloglycomyces albus]